MKTSWVLTEDDKSKVAASRRPPPAATVTDQEELSFQPGPGDLGNISIKTEAGEGEDPLGGIEHGLLTVKQRRPSSPMTPAQFRPASSQLFPGPGNSSDSQIYSSSGIKLSENIYIFLDTNLIQVFHGSIHHQRTLDCTLARGTATPRPRLCPPCRECFPFRFRSPQ